MAYLSDYGTPRSSNHHTENNITTKVANHRTDSNGVDTYDPAWATYPSHYELDIIHGRDIKDFHKRKADGELLPYTPYLNVRMPVLNKAGWLTSKFTNGSYWAQNVYIPAKGPFLFAVHDGPYPWDTAPLTLLDGWLENLGIDQGYWVQAAASGLYSRGWDALTFLAELHKTVALITGAARNFRNLITRFNRYYKRLKSQNPNKTYNQSAILQQWLEARYGWRLLLYDIKDINEVIQHIGEKSRTRNKERVGTTFQWVDDLSTYREFGSSIQTYTDTRSVILSVRGSIIADFLPASVSLNPLMTAWEIVPYSFVIDWFYNIGQSIAALSFLTLNTQYTSAFGIYCDVERHASLDLQWNPKWSGDYYQSVDQQYTITKRKPIPVPKAPLFQNRFDLPKAIDLLGLIDGLLAGALRTWSIR